MGTRVFRESMVNRDKIGRFAEKAGKGGGAGGNAAFLAKFSEKIAKKKAAAGNGGGSGLSGLSGVKGMDTSQLSGVKALDVSSLSGMKSLTPAQQTAKVEHEGKNASFLAKMAAKIDAKKAATPVKIAGPETLPKKKGISLARKEPKVITPAPAPAPTLKERNYKAVSAERAAELQAQMLKGKPWTREQRDGLRTYTGVSYSDMNGALRYGGGPERIRRHITNARAGMRETPEDITVYRGAGRGTAFGFGKGRITNAQLEALVGKTWSDPGFTSTATRKGGYGSGLRVQTVINVPAGTRGAFVEGVTQNKGEDEFVLDAGTHYKITRYERHKGGKVTLHMEVVKQDA